MDCRVCGITKSRTRQSDLHFHFSFRLKSWRGVIMKWNISGRHCILRVNTSCIWDISELGFNSLRNKLGHWVHVSCLLWGQQQRWWAMVRLEASLEGKAERFANGFSCSREEKGIREWCQHFCVRNQTGRETFYKMKKQRSLQSEGFQAFGIYTMFRKPIKHSRRGVEKVGG